MPTAHAHGHTAGLRVAVTCGWVGAYDNWAGAGGQQCAQQVPSQLAGRYSEPCSGGNVGMSFPPTLRSPEPPEPPGLEGALGGCLPPGRDDALV